MKTVKQLMGKIIEPVSLNSNWHEIESQPIENSEIFSIEKCSLNFYNIGREIWKGITKADLISFYNKISKYIMPYLLDRPQSLHLKLINAGSPGLYIKDMENRQPTCADIFTDKRRHPQRGKRNAIDYLVCNNLATLLYMVNLGCIDINPWNSRTASVNSPDYLLIDLDPTIPAERDKKKIKLLEQEGFKKAVATALATKEILDKYKLQALVKTSGKTGIHVYVPCKNFTYKHSRFIATFLCNEIHKLLPRITTRNNSVATRGNKVYVDDSQNDYGDTLAAPYSIRPYHQPTVSTPLEWSELSEKLNRLEFNFENIFDRLEQKGDLFKDLFNPRTVNKNTNLLTNLGVV